MSRRDVVRSIVTWLGAVAVVGLRARPALAGYLFFRYRFRYFVHRRRRRVRWRVRRRR